MNNIKVIKQSTNGMDYPRFSQGGDKVYTAYMNLSIEERIDLAKYALEAENKNTQWAILRNLAVYYPDSLNEFLDAILHKGIDDVGIAFKNARDEICEEVIQKIEQTLSEKKKFELLVILAWTGTKKAQDKLSEFISTPVIYGDSKLYAYDFTTYAGWELDGAGKRRDLYFPDCFPLYTKNVDKPRLTRETCPWCKRFLLLAYEVDEIMTYLPVFKKDKKIFRVMTCSHCTHFSTLYSEILVSGDCVWSTHNTRPSHMKHTNGEYGEYQEFTPQTIIEKRKKNPFEYEAWLPVPPGFNGSIGGFPGWVHYPEFPSCPSCKKTMIYVAQYDISWVVYAFRCFECEINATNIQTD